MASAELSRRAPTMDQSSAASTSATPSKRSTPASATDRAHTGRLTQGRVPADIVFGARKTKPVR
jgi:hypothetical protein